MESSVSMKALVMIVNAGFAEDVIEIARAAGVQGATVIKARGEGARHESFMGITIDIDKEMILSVVDEHVLEKVLESVKEKAGIKTLAHSICFTMPVEKIIGIGASKDEKEGKDD